MSTFKTHLNLWICIKKFAKTVKSCFLLLYIRKCPQNTKHRFMPKITVNLILCFKTFYVKRWLFLNSSISAATNQDFQLLLRNRILAENTALYYCIQARSKQVWFPSSDCTFYKGQKMQYEVVFFYFLHHVPLCYPSCHRNHLRHTVLDAVFVGGITFTLSIKIKMLIFWHLCSRQI